VPARPVVLRAGPGGAESPPGVGRAARPPVAAGEPALGRAGHPGRARSRGLFRPAPVRPQGGRATDAAVPTTPEPLTRKDSPMPSHFYAPTKEDKFAFGIWCLQNRGRDPFGDQTRPELPALECVRGLAQRNCYGFEFHDNDIIPFGASAGQRDQILRDLKKAI